MWHWTTIVWSTGLSTTGHKCRRRRLTHLIVNSKVLGMSTTSDSSGTWTHYRASMLRAMTRDSKMCLLSHLRIKTESISWTQSGHWTWSTQAWYHPEISTKTWRQAIPLSWEFKLFWPTRRVKSPQKASSSPRVSLKSSFNPLGDSLLLR